MLYWSRGAARDELRRLGFTADGIAEAMIDHLESGGEVNETQETTELWKGEVRYEFRFLMGDNKVYAKMSVDDPSPTGPCGAILSFHEGWR